MGYECRDVQLSCNKDKVLIICLQESYGIILHTTEITAVVKGSEKVISLVLDTELVLIIMVLLTVCANIDQERNNL